MIMIGFEDLILSLEYAALKVLVSMGKTRTKIPDGAATQFGPLPHLVTI